MSRYWIYISDEVKGPYDVDELIRLRGFSRDARVCREQPNGGTGEWVSPAEIPELARVFKAVDDMNKPDAVPAAPSRPMPKRPMTVSKPPVTVPVAEPSNTARVMGYIVLCLLLAAGGAGYWKWKTQQDHQRESAAARNLVEHAPFPSQSNYRSIRQYLDNKNIHPAWELERLTDGVYRVGLSWNEADRLDSKVLAFEANLPAQTVRGLNSEAQRWMEQGPDARPLKAATPSAPVKKISPEASFNAALTARQAALKNGDYATVWKVFSRRKQSEMIQAGMSESGYVKLQSLRQKVDANTQQEVLKTHTESSAAKLVLIKETQAGHNDIYLKQSWTWEDDEWHLDNEDKRAVEAPAAAAKGSIDSPPKTAGNDEGPKIPVHSLPGLSN